MTIYINDQPENIISDSTTVEDIIKEKKISSGGTAVAINGRLVRQPDWSTTILKENDNLMIISAAYGG